MVIKMKSKYVDKFNHDQDAPGYDQDVSNEAHPIRAAYSELLDWVAAEMKAHTPSRVSELGSGTGNLSIRLNQVKELTCVDVSIEMQRIAQQKLPSSAQISYVEADMLAFFDKLENKFDAVVSTYTIHHLTEAEKQQLFEKIESSLEPGGLAVFGDLMFENQNKRDAYLEQCRRSGQAELADDIEDEFFWNVELALKGLQALGLEVETRQFSALSWGIVARKPS
jgi:putative AdoMet-dependent methyltransferase